MSARYVFRSSVLLFACAALACSGDSPDPFTPPVDDPGPATPQPATSLAFLPGQWTVSAVRFVDGAAVDTLGGVSTIGQSLNQRATKEVLRIGLADGTVAVMEALIARRASSDTWAIGRGDAAEGTFDVLQGGFASGAGTFVSQSESRPDGGLTRLRFSEAFQDSFVVHIDQSTDAGTSWASEWRFAYTRGAGTAPVGATVNACGTEGHRQFDFWLGNWNALGTNGQVNGTNDIRSRLGGCILEENWVSSPSGTSFNMYDVRTELWYQMWVDANGYLLTIQGTRDREQLSMSGTDGTLGQRITWTDLGDGRVRQFGETEQVSGVWTTAYDLTYALR